MATKYECEKCGKTFKQKSHYDTHISKKVPCVTDDKIEEIATMSKKTKKIIKLVENKLPIIDDEELDNIVLDELTISNKEALKDKIHKIHNYLRNNGAGYGMNALKVFNILYGLKKIEENGLLDSVNLKRPECEFSHLLKMANDGLDEEIVDLIFTTILDSVAESNIKELLFYEIPKNIKGSAFSYLIKEINKITLIERACNVLLSGKIYEYFIGRDASAISELGAYFTDRHITDYIYEKLQVEIYDDGTIGSMIDMFGGSGGFTTGYINYLNNNYNDIDWTTELSKVFHYDMNEDVIKSAGLEFFCLTGVLPNMNNLKYKNSFTDEFSDLSGRRPKKYDYVITNPPYGGDSNKKSGNQIKRDKIKNHIKADLIVCTDENIIKQRNKQLSLISKEEKNDTLEHEKQKVSINTCSNRIKTLANMNKLNGNNKESCSLMLMMDLLDEDGTCVGVLKEGVFFDPKYKNLRKYLIENFNITEIISIPQDQFENTKTKTSIVIFKNTEEKTSKVIFREMIVEKYNDDIFEDVNGQIILCENQGDIIGISDFIVSQARIDELLENRLCSLNGKDYIKRGIEPGIGYKMVKLGDVCTFLPKSTRKASYGQEDGQYNFYTSSSKVQRCNEADYTEKCIIIGTGGNSCIYINDGQFSCSGDTLIFNTTHQMYIYYILVATWSMFLKTMNGSTIKHVTKGILTTYQIPIPKSKKKIQMIIDKISEPYNKKIELEAKLIELELEIKNKIIEITNNEECEEVLLGDIFEITSGKFKSSDCNIDGLYPFYTGKAIQPEGYSNNYCVDKDEYIILIKDGGAGPGKYGPQIGLGNVFMVYGKSAFTCHQVALIKKDNCMYDMMVILYILKNNKNMIMDLAKYTTGLGTITKKDINDYKIKIPNNISPSYIHKILKCKCELQENTNLYNQHINQLSKESIL
jgi:type I restriction-modification system DNA methylase subunit